MGKSSEVNKLKRLTAKTNRAYGEYMNAFGELNGECQAYFSAEIAADVALTVFPADGIALILDTMKRNAPVGISIGTLIRLVEENGVITEDNFYYYSYL